jgi:hypothetical protein
VIYRCAALAVTVLLAGVAAGQGGGRLAVLSAAKALRDAGAFIHEDDSDPERPVVSVRVIGNLGDREALRVAAFKKLDHLFIDSDNVTNAGVAGVKGLAKLRDVGFHCPNVGDESVKHFATLPSLERLSLYRSGVTDAGMKGLAALPKLKRLILSRTAVTDAGLMALAEAKSLVSVSVDGTKVTDAGIKAFKAKKPGCKVER